MKGEGGQIDPPKKTTFKKFSLIRVKTNHFVIMTADEYMDVLLRRTDNYSLLFLFSLFIVNKFIVLFVDHILMRKSYARLKQLI